MKKLHNINQKDCYLLIPNRGLTYQYSQYLRNYSPNTTKKSFSKFLKLFFGDNFGSINVFEVGFILFLLEYFNVFLDIILKSFGNYFFPKFF